MDISIQIKNALWKQVSAIPKGTTPDQLQDRVYKEIRREAGMIDAHLVCYCWKTEEEVKYCGSVARDYQHGGYKSAFEGRVHNYFKNHRQQENGRTNSNLNVFENICQTLKESDVILSVLVFDMIQLGSKTYTYNEFSENPEMIQAVEQLLICYYKDLGQSAWNRTPSTRKQKPEPKHESQPEPEPIMRSAQDQIGSHTGAEEIRAYIMKQYINPCRENGIKQVRLRSGNIHKELGLKNKFPSVCQVIDGKIFQERAGLKLLTRKGPEKSSTVEWLFQIEDTF